MNTSDTPANLSAYVCVHVCEDTRPVLLVSREGGDWCFLCGDVHPQDAASYRVVGISHRFARDVSLRELTDLLPDWEAARRAVGAAWIRTQMRD